MHEHKSIGGFILRKSIILLGLIAMVLVASSLVGAANLNIEVAETTSNIEISAVPSTHR